jgi:S1-C subfamily serine protease
VSWIDGVIAAVVVLAAFRGRATGALRQIGNWVGFATGFILGTWCAPPLAHHLSSTTWRPLAAIGIVVVFSFMGAALGRLCGGAAHHSLHQMHLGSLDASVGAGVGVVSALLSCWLLAGVLVNAPWFSLAGGISQSKILVALDHVMPPVPTIEAKVATLFRGADFPSVFADIVAPSVPTVTTPANDVATQQVGARSAAVVKVIASGACGASHEGTAFVVGRNEVVTNAHVIAGATMVRVDGQRAQVRLIDIRDDLAVLSVATGSRPILEFVDPPARGTASAVVGFPLDGPLTTTPSAVAGLITARSRDLYGGPTFDRSLLVLNASVQPGNSGSPVFVSGRVIGIVVSRSTSQDTTAYAVPSAVIRADLATVNFAATVSTGACIAN